MNDELRDAVIAAVGIAKDTCRHAPTEELARADQLFLFAIHDQYEAEIKRVAGIKRMAAALMGAK